MYVEFRNLPADAISLAKNCHQEWCDNTSVEEHKCHSTGRNMMRVVHKYQHVNTDQCITINRNTIVVEGQRCALWNDEFAPLMKLLMDSNFKPAYYETSDARLEWFETLEDYYFKRASPNEAVARMVEKGYDHSNFRSLEKYRPILSLIDSGESDKAWASYATSEVMFALRIFRVEESIRKDW